MPAVPATSSAGNGSEGDAGAALSSRGWFLEQTLELPELGPFAQLAYPDWHIPLEETPAPAAGPAHSSNIACPVQPTKTWSGRLEFGFNGAEGNSRQSNLRSAAKVRRKTESNAQAFDMTYVMATNRSRPTQNQLLADGKHEWFFPETIWEIYVHGTFEYNEFTAYDSRLTSDAGLGARLFKSESAKVTARLGPGFSKEFGISEAEIVPEGVAGVSVEWHPKARHKFTLNSDFFPDLRDFSDYRSTTDGAWEVKVDEAEQLSLRLAIINRYDSTPNGSKPANPLNLKQHNDFSYTAQLVWEF
jgi:putative salt-induced outer membrane protein YdiY